jgi:DNA-binding IclR family transcriptional regulator
MRFDKVVRPIEVDGQRAAALRFGDARVQALFSVLTMFSLQPRGFTNAEMRVLLAQMLGLDPAGYSAGRMTYDLRRLRLHDIIERIPRSHRYQLTAHGLRIALFFSRTYSRLLRPGLAELMADTQPASGSIRLAFDRLESAIEAVCKEQKLAA